jgi:mono/diheme cytochrome c family protein
MKTTLPRITLLFLLLLAFLGVSSFRSQTPIARQSFASLTPTYDPLVETPLPPNPTELELGQNLYWHWCMTCHGDRGQGLTDEFRGIWEPDHQNCWARGCHAGRPNDLGFPIPTIVPGLVGGDHLAKFSSLQALSDFLQATHPPQSPGILKSEEYHAIALFVFTMNGIPLIVITSTVVPVSTPTAALVPSQEATTSPRFMPIYAIVSLAVLMFIFFVIIIRRTGRMKK